MGLFVFVRLSHRRLWLVVFKSLEVGVRRAGTWWWSLGTSLSGGDSVVVSAAQGSLTHSHPSSSQ